MANGISQRVLEYVAYVFSLTAGKERKMHRVTQNFFRLLQKKRPKLTDFFAVRRNTGYFRYCSSKAIGYLMIFSEIIKTRISFSLCRLTSLIQPVN